MARGVKRLAKQRFTASTTKAAPRTFKKLSCCPAKLAFGKSSAVADERTATSASTSK